MTGVPASIAAMPPQQALIGPEHRLIDLFAGPGGLDVGAAWLGIPTTGIELDANACATRVAAGLDTVQGDVRAYGPSDFPEATVLTGGPPCQTFTVAGAGSGRRALENVVRRVAEMEERPDADLPLEFADERTGLVLEPMRWALQAVRRQSPFRAIVLEQVPAALPVWDAFREVLERHGYGVAHGVLEIGRVRRPADSPSRHPDCTLGRHQRRTPVSNSPTLQEGRTPPIRSRTGTVGVHGRGTQRDRSFTVVSNYGSGGDPRNRGQRDSNEPSATVTGKIMRNRLRFADGDWSRLSHREAGVLQTFPHDFPWSGNDIGQQIGNAIPPRLAVHILAQALGIRFDASEIDGAVKASWAEVRRAPIRSQPDDCEDSMAIALD